MQERKTGCICELDAVTGEPVVENYEMCPVHKPDAPDPKKEAERLVEDICAGSSLIAEKVAAEILSVLEPFQRHEDGKVLIPFYQEVKKQIELM